MDIPTKLSTIFVLEYFPTFKSICVCFASTFKKHDINLSKHIKDISRRSGYLLLNVKIKFFH